MLFRNQFTNKPVSVGETNSGEIIVEKAGVIPLSERVKLATMAGYKLDIERLKQTFDIVDDGKAFMPVPKARRPGFDLVDAHNDWQEYKNKAREALQRQHEINQEKIKKSQEEMIEKEVEKRVEKRIKPVDTSPVT